MHDLHQLSSSRLNCAVKVSVLVCVCERERARGGASSWRSGARTRRISKSQIKEIQSVHESDTVERRVKSKQFNNKEDKAPAMMN